MIKLRQLIDTLDRITERRGNRLDDVNVVLEVYNPGSIGGTPCVPIVSLDLGIDWDANKLILHTDKTLSVLTDEEKAAILESVKKGQSWHAYQSHKKQSDELKKLKELNKKLLTGYKTIKSMTEVFDDGEFRQSVKEVIEGLID